MNTLPGRLLCLFIFLILACQRPYLPPVISTSHSYLVVEGVINSGDDSTIIKLSRSVRLDQKTNNPEAGALVTIENEENHRYFLTETAPGTYTVAHLNFPADKKYRLHIITAASKEYASDFVENKVTPGIDSISFKELKHGVQFYVNAHDNASKTRYYRWDYDETWTYFSLIYSNLLYRDPQVEFRTSDELVNFCYRHAVPSNGFYVATSNKLSADVIAQLPINYVDAKEQKLIHVYSLNVKQYALTAEGYAFWQLLKKNTEQIGSIFDAQPSASIGNIHAVTDKNDIVIGFVSVSTVTSKRLFIAGRDLPYPLGTPPTDTTQCQKGIILLKPLASLEFRLHQTFSSGNIVPYVVHVDSLDHIDGYFYATKECVDCRVAGGTTVKPPYWPDL